MANKKIKFISETHTYMVGGKEMPSVTRILQHLGFCGGHSFSKFDAMRGKYVHLACQYLDEGRLDETTLDDNLKPYITAYKNFKKATGFKAKYIELPVHHNLLQYCGTLDRIGTIGNKLVLIDIKTGGDYATNLQTAGYSLACRQMKLIPENICRCGVFISKDEQWSLKEYKDKSDEMIFISAVNVYNYKKERGLL